MHMGERSDNYLWISKTHPMMFMAASGASVAPVILHRGESSKAGK